MTKGSCGDPDPSLSPPPGQGRSLCSTSPSPAGARYRRHLSCVYCPLWFLTHMQALIFKAPSDFVSWPSSLVWHIPALWVTASVWFLPWPAVDTAAEHHTALAATPHATEGSWFKWLTDMWESAWNTSRVLRRLYNISHCRASFTQHYFAKRKSEDEVAAPDFWSLQDEAVWFATLNQNTEFFFALPTTYIVHTSYIIEVQTLAGDVMRVNLTYAILTKPYLYNICLHPGWEDLDDLSNIDIKLKIFW